VVHRKLVFDEWIPCFGDAMRMSLPERAFMAAEYGHGHMPLWLPYEGLGEPFLAMLSPGILHPLNLIYAELPVGRGFAWNVILATVMAAWGAFTLSRSQGFSRLASVAVGAAYGLSGPLVTQFNLTYLVATASAPWAVAGLGMAVRSPSSRTLAWGIFGVTLVLLAGDPEAAVVVFAFGLVEVLGQERGRRRRALLALTACGVGMVLLSAIQLAPSLEAFVESARWGANHAADSKWSLPAARLAELVVPGLFSTPAFGNILEPVRGWTPELFWGPVALILASSGLASSSRARCYAVLGGLLIWASLGPRFGLYRWLGAFPIWQSFQYPEKLVPFALLSASPAIATGFDALRVPPFSLRPRTGTAVTLSLAVAGAMVCLQAGAPLSHVLKALAITLTLIFVTWLLTSRSLQERLGPRTTSAMLVASICVPSALCNTNLDLEAPESTITHSLWSVDMAWQGTEGPEPPRIASQEVLSPANEKAPVGGPPLGSSGPGTSSSTAGVREVEASGVIMSREALQPDFNVGYGIESLDFPYHAFYSPAFGRVLGLGPDRLRRLRQFGVDFVFAVGETDLGSDWERIGSHPAIPLSEWRPKRRIPRAYVASAARGVLNQGEAEAAVTRSSFDPEREVVVECPTLPEDQRFAQRGRVRLSSWSPGEVIAQAEMDSTGFVILNESFSPGWEAMLDNEFVPICRANALVKAVRVGPGSHQITFSYKPKSFRIGAWVTVATLVALLMAALFELPREKQGPSPA
jgi:hypothetical protein